MNIYVGNLSTTVSENDLRDFFQSFGEVYEGVRHQGQVQRRIPRLRLHRDAEQGGGR